MKAKEVPNSDRYTVQHNYCNCHPETCCCDDYAIFKGEKKMTTIYTRDDAMSIVKALNFYRQHHVKCA